MAVYEIHLKCQTIKFHKVTLENNPRNRIPYAIIFTLRISGLPQKSIRENDTFARAKARQFAKSAKNIAPPPATSALRRRAIGGSRKKLRCGKLKCKRDCQ